MSAVESNPGQFIGHQAYVLRVVTIVPAVLSILAVPCAFVWWWYFHKPRQPKFRHVLIGALLGSDFLKAIVMIIYPIVYLHTTLNFGVVMVSPFCNGIGFLTELTIEIADFSVLLLAIHTALLVFSPRCSRGQGLYLFRYSIFLVFISVALIFSIIAVVPISQSIRSGYTHFTTWCYLRVFPSWYRLAFSWVPRIIIMITILVIYIAIFVFVKTQIKALDKSFSSLSSSSSRPESSRSSENQHSRKRPTFRLRRPKNWKESIRKFFSQFPGFEYLYPYELTVVDGDRDLSFGTDTTAVDSNNKRLTEYLQKVISSENYVRFQRRRSDIEKQVSFLFIYPIVYVLIWAFPLIQEALHYRQGKITIAVFWISLLADWFKPFTGFVNSVVFVLKESQYQRIMEGQQQQAEIRMSFVDQSQPPSRAPLTIDTTSDFIYEPKSPSPLDATSNNVTDNRRTRGSPQWARKMWNYRLNVDEEQNIETATMSRHVPSEDHLSPREKPESSSYYPRQPTEEPKPECEPTDSNSVYDLMDFLSAEKQ